MPAKKVAFQEFLQELSPTCQIKLLGLLKNSRGTDFVVLYQNIDFCSSQFGASTVMLAGPERTYALDQALNGHLNDLPSQRQYPVMYASIKEET